MASEFLPGGVDAAGSWAQLNAWGEDEEMRSGDVEVLRGLEESLWRTETRFDRTYMKQLLHPEFFEFGRSGRIYTRDRALDAEPGTIDAELPLREFVIHPLDADVALVTYLSVVRYDTVEVGNRSSLWVRGGDGWLLRFHQGTPAPRVGPPSAIR